MEELRTKLHKLYFMVTTGDSGKGQGVCVLCDGLTIRHILHNCNHRPTEMDGAQGVVFLTHGQEAKG